MKEQEKHDCERWRDEGTGCSICRYSHSLTLEELKEAQEHANWRITSLKEELAQEKEKSFKEGQQSVIDTRNKS